VVKPSADAVALVLAAALVLAVLVLGIALIANVIEHQNPAATLGENTTQVLTATVGGIIGVLGSYLGRRSRRDPDHDE
jgi:hypothetical protein